MSKQNETNNIKKKIKYGILFQKSDNLKINELFNNYFDTNKPNIIKNEPKDYEFNLDKYENLNFSFIVITEEEIKNIYKIYNYFNFFLIFIDIQSTASVRILELYVNQLIDCSPDNTKKSYIFGVYKDEKEIINKDEKITIMLNCKGIDYEYSEINIKKNEDFPKGMEYIIEDSKEIMEETEFQEIHNKLGRDKGKSCEIM
jgi:hypothetical protein